MNTLHLRLLLAILATVPLVSSAASQPSGGRFFRPPNDDTSISMLRDVFGNIVDFVTGNASAADLANNNTVLGAGFAVFCTAVLTLGLLFVAYTVITGTINTAHDGSFLGKKMSDIWVPLRTLAGSAILLPLAGGFCLIQIIIMWLAVQGVGVADATWTAMLNRVDQVGMVARPNIPSARSLAAQIFKYEVCAAAMNKSYAEQNRPERITALATQRTIDANNAMWHASPTAVIVTDYSWSATGGYMAPNVCGSLTWQASNMADNGNAQFVGPLIQTHGTAVRNMIVYLRPYAQQVVAGQKPSAGPIEKAAYAYENALQFAARNALQTAETRGKDDFITYAKQGGWVHAGGYYNHVIMLSDAVQSAVNSLPQPSTITITDKETESALVGFRDAMAVADEFTQMRSESANAFVDSNMLKGPDLAVSCIGTSSVLGAMVAWDTLKKCFNDITLRAMRGSTQILAGSNTSHMSQVKALGDWIVMSAEAIVGAQFVAVGVAKAKGVDWTVGTVFNFGDALLSVGGFIIAIALALFVAGVTMAFYMPLIPFISWVTGVIKWITSVIEALIAGPIFAAAHIHPDGDDAIGRAGPGYYILLSMMMRPSLLLFGLMASIAVAQPVAHFVNQLYLVAVQGAMHDSINLLGAFVAYNIIYVIIMTTVLHAVFSLIHWVPDTVMRWMGSAVGMHGVADGEDKEARHVFGAAAVRMNSTMGEGGGRRSRPSGGGGGKPSQGDDSGKEPPKTSEEDHASS